MIIDKLLRKIQDQYVFTKELILSIIILKPSVLTHI